MIVECRGRGWRARKRAATLLQSRLYVLNRRSAWSVIPLGTYYLEGNISEAKDGAAAGSGEGEEGRRAEVEVARARVAVATTSLRPCEQPTRTSFCHFACPFLPCLVPFTRPLDLIIFTKDMLPGSPSFRLLEAPHNSRREAA